MYYLKKCRSNFILFHFRSDIWRIYDLGNIASDLVQGKLIEIHFSTMGKICGAKIQTCKHLKWNLLILWFYITWFFLVIILTWVLQHHLHVNNKLLAIIMDSSSRKGNFLLYLNLNLIVIFMFLFWNHNFCFEKSRVVQLAYGERSYHIFYQLCAGAPTDLKGSTFFLFKYWSLLLLQNLNGM